MKKITRKEVDLMLNYFGAEFAEMLLQQQLKQVKLRLMQQVLQQKQVKPMLIEKI